LNSDVNMKRIEQGRVYRAKVPRNVSGLYNDRVILRIIGATVQYDGPAVANGRQYPKCAASAFFKWMGEDVTDQMPEGRWAEWDR
jgi:hypothetical protein